MTVCTNVWSQSHCKGGITLCSRPKEAALVVIIFHVLIGVSKGDPENGWTKAIGKWWSCRLPPCLRLRRLL